MKQNIKFIGIVIVAALVGFVAMYIAIAFDASDKVAIMSYFCVAVTIAIALGAFDMGAQKRNELINQSKNTASYGEAA